MRRAEIDVEHFRARILQDALNEATADYWQRRAAHFDAARHNAYVWGTTLRRHGYSCPPGCTKCPVIHHKGDPKVDLPGRMPAEERCTRDARLAGIAAACRARAALSLLQTDSPEVADALEGAE